MDYVADVVICARNEEDTIGAVIQAFMYHPAIQHVLVCVDKDTADQTAVMASVALSGMTNGWVYNRLARGKGQLALLGLTGVTTPYVIFCDADITGITHDHVSLLVSQAVEDWDSSEPMMTVGVPEVPANLPTERLWAWPWVSGQRCVPTALVRPLHLHGYLMETQINAAARHANMPVRFEWLRGVVSEYKMTDHRLAEMARDALWGKEHGILLWPVKKATR